MKKKFQTNYLLALLFIVEPLLTFDQEDGSTFRKIEPLPTPMIDDLVIHFDFCSYFIHEKHKHSCPVLTIFKALLSVLL